MLKDGDLWRRVIAFETLVHSRLSLIASGWSRVAIQMLINLLMRCHCGDYFCVRLEILWITICEFFFLSSPFACFSSLKGDWFGICNETKRRGWVSSESGCCRWTSSKLSFSCDDPFDHRVDGVLKEKVFSSIDWNDFNLIEIECSENLIDLRGSLRDLIRLICMLSISSQSTVWSRSKNLFWKVKNDATWSLWIFSTFDH